MDASKKHSSGISKRDIAEVVALWVFAIMAVITLEGGDISGGIGWGAALMTLLANWH